MTSQQNQSTQETKSTKKKEVIKPILITIRVTAEERKEFEEKAKKEFRSVTGFIKSRCLD